MRRDLGSLVSQSSSLGAVGLENVLRMSSTRSLLHVLGLGAGTVIRLVWALTCDRETRRPRPRRDGAKITGVLWSRAVNGPGFVARGGGLVGGLRLSFAKQVSLPAPESIFLRVFLLICIYRRLR